jgi:hypothetical protein
LPRPEILTDRQYYPRSLSVDGDVLFWVNGVTAAGSNQVGNNQILSCRIENCGATIEVRDEGNIINGLVVDPEAIYWFHLNATTIHPRTQMPLADLSIRRTPRSPQP